jgi:deoxyribodipyrimidine photo-lyase
MNSVPGVRVSRLNDAPVHVEGLFVLYWMTASRRASFNFALEHAVGWAERLNKPLLILEALRCDYPWASDRFHAFALHGMMDNHRTFIQKPVTYYPYVEDSPSVGKGLIQALAGMACIVVTDAYPAFFLPRMLRATASRLSVRMESVDSNGILPMNATDQIFTTAYSFRRHLQKHLPEHLRQFPKADPLASVRLPVLPGLPREIAESWPPAPDSLLQGDPSHFSGLPLDHGVGVVGIRGGSETAAERLSSFLAQNLTIYHESRNHPDEGVFSGLSPYLHFGHVSAHQIVAAVMDREEWSPASLASKASGQRSGWWGMSEGAEAFLDQVITWRELGFNMCSHMENYDQLETLPPWALKELLSHASDPRAYLYCLEDFERARTHDDLWNCAQNQLVQEGTIHNYLRMLWGKKILEWSRSPRDALTIMIELNNKYALDGRDPNSYTGIFWVLGRYDRPWAPERPVFGRIRFMSSASTMRKIKLRDYLARYSNRS